MTFKSAICFLLFVSVCGVFAADIVPITVSGVWSGATVTVTSSLPASGYIEAIKVDHPGVANYTGTVSVAGKDETILALTSCTADDIYYPMRPTCSTNGVSVTTWATNTSGYARFFICREPIVVQITTGFTGTATRTFNFVVKMDDK